MTPRILIVDDEPNVISAYQRALRRIFESDGATNGQEALETLVKKGPFAVIVSDMRMPGMSGITLLQEAKRIAPDTVRIMLTGADDQKTAADAVNNGHVFRFLHKPCTADVFLKAIQDAVDSHLAASRERDLLEGTFNGAVRMLTDMLAAAQPGTFGESRRVRDRVLAVARAMSLPNIWEIESAALLYKVGAITIPPTLLEKVRIGEALSKTETHMLDRLPEIGARLLENIPRLAPVAEIVRFHRRGFDGSGTPVDGPSGEQIPVGARVLRAVIDCRALEAAGESGPKAVDLLRHEIQRYDPDVLTALDHTGPTTEQSTSAVDGEYRMVAELKVGMTLGSDALSDAGFPLIMAGTELSEVLIARLRNFADLGQVREPLFVLPGKEPAEA